MRITEIKRWLDGREEAFVCDALYVAEAVAVLRFQVPPDSNYTVHDTVIPPGATTFAVFWAGANYLVYRMMDAGGDLIGHRFDVCKALDITKDAVKWTDLVLDAWVDSSNHLTFLDEEEVVELQEKGLISQEDVETITNTKEFLSKNYLQVIAKTEEVLKQVGELSSVPWANEV